MILPAPSFPYVPGEAPGDRIARIVRAYAGCSLSSRREELAALVGRGVNDEAFVALKTNCATFALGVLSAAGVRHKKLSAPTAIGAAFSDLVTLGNDLKAWRPWAGSGSIPVGAALWYEIPNTDDDHVEFYLSPDGPEHGGGGRDDNAVTVGRGPVALSWGRPVHKWLDPGALGISVAPIADTDPAPPLDVEPHRDVNDPHV